MEVAAHVEALRARGRAHGRRRGRLGPRRRRADVSRVGRARPRAAHGRGAPLGHELRGRGAHRAVGRRPGRGRGLVAARPRAGGVAGAGMRRPGGRAGRRAPRPRVLDLPAGAVAPRHVGPPAGARDGHPPGRRRAGGRHGGDPVLPDLRRRRRGRAAVVLRDPALLAAALRDARLARGVLHGRGCGLAVAHRRRPRDDRRGPRRGRDRRRRLLGPRPGGRPLPRPVEPRRTRGAGRRGRPGRARRRSARRCRCAGPETARAGPGSVRRRCGARGLARAADGARTASRPASHSCSWSRPAARAPWGRARRRRAGGPGRATSA